MNIEEICENTKMGREYALLGNYETSMVYYQGVLQQIQKMLASIREPDRKHRWQKVGQRSLTPRWVVSTPCLVTMRLL